MKEIQPISAWINGQSLSGTLLVLQSTNDNLVSSATFQYQILSPVFDENNTITSCIVVAQGTLYMDGEEYQTWGQSSNINDEAFAWAAQQLNLTLV